MRITFVSNLFNHHQYYLSQELAVNPNVQYKFIQTMHVTEELLRLGYHDYKNISFVENVNVNNGEKIALPESDVFLLGSINEKNFIFNEEAIKLRYSERLFKNRRLNLQNIKKIVYAFAMKRKLSERDYLLCASAYTKLDYNKIGLYENRAFKWGYFPECKKYNEISDVINGKNNTEILWCGRFLKWKHPDIAINSVIEMHAQGYPVHLTMIGTGELEDSLQKLIAENNASSYISMLGSMSPENVRLYMEKAGIYLFTSDRNEGWGAVLNESMNSACAVIANGEIGSVPYLIENNKNGLIYYGNSVAQVCEKLKYLIDNPLEQSRIGKEAYNTIIYEWNSKVAAERLVNLIEQIIAGNETLDLYSSGPCSKA